MKLVPNDTLVIKYNGKGVAIKLFFLFPDRKKTPIHMYVFSHFSFPDKKKSNTPVRVFTDEAYSVGTH